MLLLDEPFAALNPMLRQKLREELAQLRAAWQIPLVMVSHDIDDVLALANVALLLDQGRVLREVNLDHAQSREIARQTLEPHVPTRAPRAQEPLLRRLLGGTHRDQP